MTHDPIFQALPTAVLAETAHYLGFNPIISSTNSTASIFLSSLPKAEQESWLDQNRSALEDEFCNVGSWTFGATKAYGQVVRDLAGKINASYAPESTVVDLESAIVAKVWNDAAARMTPEQLAEIRQQMEQLASKYGKSLGKEFSGLAALSAAQLSGFGVYLLGSTVLGAINGALGLGLSFGAFTGLSSLISTVIGPVGWATLGLAAIVKLGAPNYKKVLPVVILIARTRPMIAGRDLALANIKAFIATSTSRETANTARFTFSGESLTVTWGVPETSLEVPFRDLPSEVVDKLLGSPMQNQEAIALDANSPSPTDAQGTAREFGLTVEQSAWLAKSPEPILDPTNSIQEDIARATRRKRGPASAAPSRTLSKLERSIFRLKNPELCRVAESLGVDYLDLNSTDQGAVRDMLAEQEQFVTGLQKEMSHNASDPQRKSKNTSKATSSRDRKRNRLAAKRSELRHLLENLEFSDSALGVLSELPNDDYLPFLNQLRQINQGHFNPKRTIAQTDPKVLEQEAGRSGRIYFRVPNGNPRTVIELVGTKVTQEADLRTLRGRK